MQSIISNIETKRADIREIAGDCVIIELKLKLLAEKNPLFRKEVHKLAAKKKKWKNYWNCMLEVLCSAIDLTFGDKLTPQQKNVVKLFKSSIRNEMLHANFIEVIVELGLSPDGQQVLSDGKRNQLKWPNDSEVAAKEQILNEAVASFCRRNDVIRQFRILRGPFEEIVDDLLRSCSC